jgi:hypothetical protein
LVVLLASPLSRTTLSAASTILSRVSKNSLLSLDSE